jgi:hypothetical protein
MIVFSTGLRQMGQPDVNRSPHIWQVPWPHKKTIFFNLSKHTGHIVCSFMSCNCCVNFWTSFWTSSTKLFVIFCGAVLVVFRPDATFMLFVDATLECELLLLLLLLLRLLLLLFIDTKLPTLLSPWSCSFLTSSFGILEMLVDPPQQTLYDTISEIF